MKIIEPDKWKRRRHFKFFRKFGWPHFNTCTDIDITDTYHYTRLKKYSINAAVTYIVTLACNQIEEFRYRIEGDVIKVYDLVHPGVTVLGDEDIYGNCIIEFSEPFNNFVKTYNKSIAQSKKENIIGEKQEKRNDLIYTSSLPWISFTSITNPMPIDPDDSYPRIIWGKHFKRENKIFMPFSVQVNHCLMDGVHIGRFFFKLAELLKNPENTLS